MADTLMERLTGQAIAAAVPVEVTLVMTDTTLLSRSDGPARDEPAQLLGLGPVPAPIARDLLRDTTAQVWLRRVFTHPEDGALVAMESRRRRFPDGLRRLLVLRDQTCRTPWCDARIRHTDHVVPAEAGGPTSAANGQGLCEACNHTKTLPGWHARPAPGGAGHSVKITTPTGHTYTSRPPLLSGQRPRGRPTTATAPQSSPLDTRLRQALEAA